MTNWTKDNIPNLHGKLILITGANSGLGYECSLALAEKGAMVIMTCRDLVRAHRSLEAIKHAVPDAKLELMELDLARSFKSKYDQLDILVNNGGPIIAFVV